jgi:Xaa-Pro aminopeptidase
LFFVIMFCICLNIHCCFYLSGSGPNGAIVHYRAEPGTCAEVNDKKLFLLDSGGQYVDGTTDITRTVHFGIPAQRERECFTRVLQVWLFTKHLEFN